jgi:hypothetical protein
MIEKYLDLSDQDKRLVLEQTAAEMGVDPVVVEKDLWVTAILGILFTHPETKDRFVFKGGTSLSKVYGAIRRFSEDVDLIVDWRLLGLGDADKNPWDPTRSRTKQDRFNKSLGGKTDDYLRSSFVPFLREQFPPRVSVGLSEHVLQSVEVHYPAIFSGSYVQEKVLLEIGPLASWIPSAWRRIKAEVGRIFPRVVGEFEALVNVTTAERSFWEKVTIAHQLVYSGRSVPDRYSRHYYDIVMLARCGIADAAFEDIDLLRDVAAFKDRFYPSRSARYDLARPGTLRIVPDANQQRQLEADYREMGTMFFEVPPGWDELIEELTQLEERANALPSEIDQNPINYE